MSPRVSKWPTLASIAFLLLAAVGGWPCGFYTLLRLVVCGSAIYLAVQANKLRKSAWVWVMGGTAVLFNPLVPVRVHRSDWQVLDFIGAVVFGTSLFTIREKPVSGRGILRVRGVLRWLLSEGRGPAEDLQTADPVEEAAKPVSIAPRPLISDMAEGDITDRRVREWIDEEYRRATSVPVETGTTPAPPGTSSRDEPAPPKDRQHPERPALTQRPLRKRVKGILELLAGLGFITLLFLIGGAARYGVVWLTGKLYPLAEGIATFATVVLVFVLLPSALFKRNRDWCGTGILWVSYAWGAAMWMWATLVLYGLWGKLGVVLGFVVGPVSVPLACVVLLFSGKFKLLGEAVLGVALVFATCFFGLWLTPEAERDSSAAIHLAPLPYRWGKFFAALSAFSCLLLLCLTFLAVRAEREVASILAFFIAVLAGTQAWGLWNKRKFGLVVFYILCLVTIGDVVLSYIPSVEWGEPGGGLGGAVLHLGSLPYFLKRRREFV